MKFFIDTADVGEIKKWADSGFLDGVTTNPSLIAKSGRDFLDVIREICGLIESPVSAEVAALDHATMLKEAMVLKDIAPNVVIKLPTTLDGLKTCRQLTDMGVDTNLTLCFSTNQALLAAKAGATYISPFIGRLDDINLDGMELIRDIRTVYDNYGFDTGILAASIRTPNHVSEAALAGADVATIPASTLAKLANHPLTDKGLDASWPTGSRPGNRFCNMMHQTRIGEVDTFPQLITLLKRGEAEIDNLSLCCMVSGPYDRVPRVKDAI